MLSTIWGITSHFSRDYDVGGMVTGGVNALLGKSDIKNATSNIDQAQAAAYARGEMTPAESSQYAGSFDLGTILKQITLSQQGLGQAPAGYETGVQQYEQQTGPLGTALYNSALQGVQNPYAGWQSALNPQLQAASDYISSQMQQRGLLQSGMSVENMGRAGVDLAVQNAQNMMTYGQQSLTNAASMSDAVQNTQANNLANLSSLYNQQQGYGQAAMGRQANQALGVLPTQVQPFQAQLGYGYGQLASGQKAVTKSAAQGINTLGSAATGGSPNLGASFFPTS